MDIDPVVVLHANVLLRAGDKSVAVQGDFRSPGDILADPAVRGHLDFGRPVAVLLLGLLHFVSDADDPAGAIGVLRDQLAPGSYVTVSTVVRGRVSDRKAATEAVKVYDHANARLYPRSEEELEAMFAGFELLDVPAGPRRPPPGARCPEPRLVLHRPQAVTELQAESEATGACPPGRRRRAVRGGGCAPLPRLAGVIRG